MTTTTASAPTEKTEMSFGRLVVGYGIVTVVPGRRDRDLDHARQRARACARDRGQLRRRGQPVPRRRVRARAVGRVRQPRRERQHRREAPARRQRADRRRHVRRRHHAGRDAHGHGRRRERPPHRARSATSRSPPRWASELPEPGAIVQAAGEALGRGDVRPADAGDRGRDPRGARDGAPARAAGPAAGDGRGARRDPARADAARRDRARGQGLPLPAGHRPADRRRRPDRAGVLPLPRRDGARPEADPRSASARRPSSRTRASPSRSRSASSPRSRSTASSRRTSTTCRSPSSWASRCRSRRSPCSRASSSRSAC